MTMPKKSNYRQRAHVNPYSTFQMTLPSSPSNLCLPCADYVDIGCGYGTFLLSLAKDNPNKMVYGLEIRKKVYEFVRDKIVELKKKSDENESSALKDTTPQDKMTKKMNYENVHVIRTNALLFFPHFFFQASLEKIFVLFPDPQFKKKRKKARIVSPHMIQYYEYCLKKGGRIYISTDVKELFLYMVESLDGNDALRPLSDVEKLADDLFSKVGLRTDESKRAGAKADVIYTAAYEKSIALGDNEVTTK